VADVLRLAHVALAVLRGPGVGGGAGRPAARRLERLPDPRRAAGPGAGRAPAPLAVLGVGHAGVRARRDARCAAAADAPAAGTVALDGVDDGVDLGPGGPPLRSPRLGPRPLAFHQPARDEHHQRVGQVADAVEQLADALLGHARVLVVAEALLQRLRGPEQL